MFLELHIMKHFKIIIVLGKLQSVFELQCPHFSTLECKFHKASSFFLFRSLMYLWHIKPFLTYQKHKMNIWKCTKSVNEAQLSMAYDCFRFWHNNASNIKLLQVLSQCECSFPGILSAQNSTYNSKDTLI
jgi:hypothetical protein